MRVLIFTPTFGKLLRPETVASVRAQVGGGTVTHEVSRHNPFPGADNRNVLAQYERARELALGGGYDALLTVEHDMLLPPAALAWLAAADAPVAYGVYVLRHGAAVLNAWEKLPRSRNLGESLSLKPAKLAAAQRAGVVEVSGVGFGCTLLRRDVLDRIPFRSGGSGSEAPDVPFATDCLRAGVRQVAHFGVACGHWDGAKWLWPDGRGHDDRVTVRVNQDVTVRTAGATRRLVGGEVLELPAADVAEWQRAGYVTPL